MKSYLAKTILCIVFLQSVYARAAEDKKIDKERDMRGNEIKIAGPHEQRALIIGINKYLPPPNQTVSGYRSDFQNLNGCVNDAKEMTQLITSTYHFNAKNVMSLYDEKATRENILDSMDALLAESKSGDIAFIYYAGHGSEVKNSLSTEPGHLDQSMVPSNTWQKGVEDIRDKELSKIFNAFTDKGVILTVIFDCCHSGNMSRGAITDQPLIRYATSADYDAKDGSNPPDPSAKENSKFLMMSSCQSSEFASETMDESNDPHGAFTVALIEALKQLSFDASAEDLFNETHSILKFDAKNQEPVLDAPAERRQGTLFGMDKGLISGKSLVSVMGNDGDRITLEAGTVNGIDSGSSLKSPDDNFHLEVVEMYGINQCYARVTKGDIHKIKGGDLFEVTNWVSKKKSFLNVYVPTSSLSYSEVTAIGDVCTKLKSNKKINWVTDISISDPSVILYYKSNKWYASVKGKIEPLEIKDFNADNIANQFKGNSVFINIPPTRELYESFQHNFAAHPNVKMVSDENSTAQYSIVGRIGNQNTLEYAFFQTNFAVKDSLESMPVKTEFQSLTSTSQSNVVDSLSADAYTLGKIRVWLTLHNQGGQDGYPFLLKIKDETTNKWINPDENKAKVGDKLSLHINVDHSNSSNVWDGAKRYVYVFMVDHTGKTKLLFPRRSGNDENRLPIKDDNDHLVDYLISTKMKVSSPTGTDNYYMLSTSTPISSYYLVFNQPGVTRSAAKGARNEPLNDLLNMGNITSRGIDVVIPNDWSLQRVAVKTMYEVNP